MVDLAFQEGYKEFTINGDASRTIRIKVSDLNLMQRITSLKKNLEEKEKMYKGISTSTNPENIEESVEKMYLIEREVRVEIDQVFDAPICDTVFGSMNCMSPVNGKPVVRGFLMALIPEIEKAWKSEEKKMKKYTKAVEQYD